jgi:uncharacterized Zn finger protein
VEAFPQRTDPRLREFLAREYHRRGRHADAVVLAWSTFTDRPGLEEYRTLKAHADRAGAWPSWREKALTHLRETIARAQAARPRATPSPWHEPTDWSELVRIFLWEKDVEAAWREARDGGCSADLWLQLAGKREGKHPADALPIYQAHVETTLGLKNNDAYREAVGLLRKIRQLMVRAGGPADFATYLESVRTAHKPKRNFQKLLLRARWE